MSNIDNGKEVSSYKNKWLNIWLQEIPVLCVEAGIAEIHFIKNRILKVTSQPANLLHNPQSRPDSTAARGCPRERETHTLHLELRSSPLSRNSLEYFREKRKFLQVSQSAPSCGFCVVHDDDDHEPLRIGTRSLSLIKVVRREGCEESTIKEWWKNNNIKRSVIGIDSEKKIVTAHKTIPRSSLSISFRTQFKGNHRTSFHVHCYLDWILLCTFAIIFNRLLVDCFASLNMAAFCFDLRSE